MLKSYEILVPGFNFFHNMHIHIYLEIACVSLGFLDTVFGIHHFLSLEYAVLGAGVPFQRRSCPCSGTGRERSKGTARPVAYIPDVDVFHPSQWLNVCQPLLSLWLLPGVLPWRANLVQCGGVGKGTRWRHLSSPHPTPHLNLSPYC